MDPRLIAIALIAGFFLGRDTPTRTPGRRENEGGSPEPTTPNLPETPTISSGFRPSPDAGPARLGDGGYRGGLSPGEAFRRITVRCASPGSGATVSLANELCNRIVSCNPNHSCETCFASLESLALGSRLGLSGGSLGAIEWGLQAGLYRMDSESMSQCLEDLREIPCSEVPVRSPRSLASLIPAGSCGEVFSQPERSCASPSPDPAQLLAAGLCSRMAYCEAELGCEACLAGAMEAGGVGTFFGGGVSTLQDLATELQERRISIDSTALNACLGSIEEWSCHQIDPIWTPRIPSRIMLGMALRRGLDPICRHVFSFETE